MAEMAVQGLVEFWPCKGVNNPNFGLPIVLSHYPEYQVTLVKTVKTRLKYPMPTKYFNEKKGHFLLF